MALTEMDSIPRRTMVLFFLVDCSGSMSGSKIDAVNTSIRETLPIVENISLENPDADIKVAAMTFDNHVNWLTPVPVSASDFGWVDVSAGGCTALGAACEELANKLSRKEFLHSDGGYYAPAFILLSDGEPTDDFVAGHDKLKSNQWYKHGIKTAIAIGNDADENVLAQFTGTKEAVFTVHNRKSLEKIIRVIAVTSSQIGSSSAVNEGNKQDQVNQEVKKSLENDGDFSFPNDNNDIWD